MQDLETKMMQAFRGKIEIDQRGHNGYFKDFLFVNVVTNKHLSLQDKQLILEAWRTQTPLENPISYQVPWFSHEVCGYCRCSEFWFDGFHLTAKQECSMPDGIHVKVELKVPSGRLCVGNDFRKEFPCPGDEEYDINADYAVAQVIEAYEQGKMLHFYVGNSSPSVYRTPGEFLIGNVEYDEDGNPIGSLGEEVAVVDTALWWVSIVDGDEADRRKLGETNEFTEIKVEPGTYVLEYYGLTKGFERYPESGNTIEAKLYKKTG